MKRRVLLTASLATPFASWAQKAAKLESIGVGPFEFPIPGVYTFEKQNSTVLITTPTSDRTFTVGRLTGPSSSPGASDLEAVTRNSWEAFVKQEGGKVVARFKRMEVSDGVIVFSMASEFGEGRSLQYYVQFTAVARGEIAILYAEGTGSATSVLAELEPQVRQVKVRR